MSLAGPQRKHKISRDPNNIHWASNTNTFGRKILASQGWLPGQALGLANASHARHFTKASTSHVRVALREDNLGLGAKSGSGQGVGECTGLNNFQDLLGRLNGKTEAVIKKERLGREDANRISYADRKYGGWGRFVSAGYLIGDDIVEGQLDSTPTFNPGKSDVTSHATDDKKISQAPANSKSGEKKPPTVTEKGEDGYQRQVEERSTRKEEKAERKAERARRRLDRAKSKAEKAVKKPKEESTLKSEQRQISEGLITIPQSRAVSIGTTNPIFAGGRHALRRKYIMQKKAATMDSKALNEILMVKG